MSLADMVAQSRKLNSGDRSRDFSNRGSITLPMSAYYGMNPDRQKRRDAFYYNCAMIFEFDGWNKKPIKKVKAPISAPGRDGAVSMVERYGHYCMATFRDNMAHPVEFFESSSLLEDETDKSDLEKIKNAAKDAGNRRTRLARTYFEVRIGAEVSGLSSANMDGMPTGKGGSITPSDFKVDCMRRISKWEIQMPPIVKIEMDQVLYQGKFNFLNDSKRLTQVYLDRIRIGLDIIANIERELSYEDLLARWEALGRWYQWNHNAKSGKAAIKSHQNDSKGTDSPNYL